MSYTKKEFAHRLRQQLANGYDAVNLARWAYAELLRQDGNLDAEVESEMMTVVVMEQGPEFEMTELEINQFANELENQNANET